jgi:hypothetical protein
MTLAPPLLFVKPAVKYKMIKMALCRNTLSIPTFALLLTHWSLPPFTLKDTELAILYRNIFLQIANTTIMGWHYSGYVK